MSIKIYEGLRMRKRGPQGLFSTVEELVRKSRPLVIEEVRRHRSSDSQGSGNALYKAYLEQLSSAQEGPFDFRLDLSFRQVQNDVLVFPTYGLGMTRVWRGMREAQWFKYLFIPYGYWDNTDPDENCSEREWEQRRVAWTKAMDRWDEYIVVELCHKDLVFTGAHAKPAESSRKARGGEKA